MRIQHNILAMNSYRNYNTNTSALGKNLEKLSSGYKINRAGDDAAGLAISEKMRAQITGLDAAQKNVKDGISLVKTAEGAMQEIQDMVKRMKYLATQSANGTYDENVDRVQLQKEVDSLMSEIDRIADSANFNGIKLLDGSMSSGEATFTQATSATATAKMEITLSDAKNLIGGSIQVGNKTYRVELAAGTLAAGSTATFDGTVLKMGTGATASTVVSALVAKLGSTLKAKDLDGNEANLTVAASGGKIKITATKAGVKLDVTSLPTFSFNGGRKLQIGDTPHNFNQIRVGANDMHADNLFLGYSVDITTADKAGDALNYIQYASNLVSSTRGDLGAAQNRLDHTASNLSVMAENIQDAESTIRDTDVADEMMAYTKNNILIQSAQAMLAQANAVPQGVLQLLQ
ncbi:flagellin N-terminal helical domain-containing protein [Acutalibacter sp. 1XD8-36]|uniref:flagellin N-terminal helical domain-containing protein n=1 Tax=Acutalibacter sp. 1XD8-36 TaxID=2320852 RepID=UPI001412774D|nr:flagellin [Acutalibacter sp. 1XD8-36]NBJ90927.1 flagellin [Acutalibacter sp. 1XD8-36]